MADYSTCFHCGTTIAPGSQVLYSSYFSSGKLLAFCCDTHLDNYRKEWREAYRRQKIRQQVHPAALD